MNLLKYRATISAMNLLQIEKERMSLNKSSACAAEVSVRKAIIANILAHNLQEKQ